jgi:hypothetical protein
MGFLIYFYKINDGFLSCTFYLVCCGFDFCPVDFPSSFHLLQSAAKIKAYLVSLDAQGFSGMSCVAVNVL